MAVYIKKSKQSKSKDKAMQKSIALLYATNEELENITKDAIQNSNKIQIVPGLPIQLNSLFLQLSSLSYYPTFSIWPN